MPITFFVFLSSGLFLGWSLGANDAANVFGTAVGTRMVRFRTAAIIASIFVILGAVYGGSGTSDTLNHLGDVNAIAGSFMVVIAAALTILWMTKSKISVSTSQAIVGAIIGWNLYSGKPTDITLLTTIVSTWIICPILAGAISVILFLLVKSLIKKASVPLLRQDYYIRVGLILAGAFGAYALGANNIANVIGVFIGSNELSSISLPFGINLSPAQVLFLLGGIAIATGIATYSKKIMLTVGNDIMAMSPLVAWIVVVSQSIVLFLFASPSLHHFLEDNGLPTIPLVPVSSSQAVIGAVMGIGILKGGHGINWSIIYKFVIGWIATPLIAALTCFISLFFLENVFNLTVYI
jgi:PiT family inorganic phosphate transporter